MESKNKNEIITALKRIGFYYILLIISMVLSGGYVEKTAFTRNLATIYLLILSVCLVLYYSHRVSPKSELSNAMKIISWMCLLLIFFRGIKYTSVSEVDILARHTWYLYYIPILFIPLFLFYISLCVSPKKHNKFLLIWYIMLAVTILFIVLIMTNDFHQQVFIFNPNFEGWDGIYSYGWLFYVINVWQYSLYFISIIILIYKCRIGSSKKNSWIIFIPVTIGVILYVLLLTGKIPTILGSTIIEFPEAHIFATAIVLECCIILGLIPTNTYYGEMFKTLPISSQIIDYKGKEIFSSLVSKPITQEHFNLSDGSRIAEHELIHKMEIPGGFGFWRDDVSNLDKLNDELEEAKEILSQEAELTKLRNELKEKRTILKQRTFVYDMIAKHTQRQSQTISNLAKSAQESNDYIFKDNCRRKIILLGAYIKRYANLMLLSEGNEYIEVGELSLSISEVLHYLNYNKVPCEFVGESEEKIKTNDALIIFEFFETLIEDNYSEIKGIFTNLSYSDKVNLKLIFECPNITISDNIKTKMKESNIVFEVKNEDEIAYINISIDKGGTYDII